MDQLQLTLNQPIKLTGDDKVASVWSRCDCPPATHSAWTV